MAMKPATLDEYAKALLAEDGRLMEPGRCWNCGRFTQHGMTACSGHELTEAAGEVRWMTPLVICEVLDRQAAPCDGDLSELGGEHHGMQGQEGRPEAMKMKPKKPKKGRGGY